MKLLIDMNLDNEAFELDLVLEVERIFKNVVARLWQGDAEGKLFDLNGNSVGDFEVRI